jgi:2-iminobutanoate/2-iminopropanoate deaminase
MKRRFPPTHPTKAAYSPMITYDLGAQRMVFLAGQIAVGADGQVVAPGDAAAQTKYIFEQISRLLADAAASLDDLVKVQIFLTDIGDFQRVSEVRNAFLGTGLPVSTLLEVGATVRPGCVVEIDGIAICEAAS